MLYDYCLSTGKPLSGTEKEIGWTKGAMRHVFGCDSLPNIQLSDEAFLATAMQHVERGTTVSGVQKKLSIGFIKSGSRKLTAVEYPTGYLLKPQSPEGPYFPESENLVMQLADIAGIPTVPHGLIALDNGLAYICKRIDREGERKIPMEDFCQLSLHLTEDKYIGSYEAAKKVIASYSCRPKLDAAEYLYRLIFCFLTLNSDMHLKNFSLWDKGSGYCLSPAYDLLPVNLVFPSDLDETALTLNGKRKVIVFEDFLRLASAGSESVRVEERVLRKMVSRLLSLQEKFEDAVEKSYLSKEYKQRFTSLMLERFERLK